MSDSLAAVFTHTAKANDQNSEENGLQSTCQTINSSLANLGKVTYTHTYTFIIITKHNTYH